MGDGGSGESPLKSESPPRNIGGQVPFFGRNSLVCKEGNLFIVNRDSHEVYLFLHELVCVLKLGKLLQATMLIANPMSVSKLYPADVELILKDFQEALDVTSKCLQCNEGNQKKETYLCSALYPHLYQLEFDPKCIKDQIDYCLQLLQAKSIRSTQNFRLMKLLLGLLG